MISELDGSMDRLRSEAARLRDAGVFGRSVPLTRLFDFLLDRSLAGLSPKEIEIAQEVFDKSADFDMGTDASVRVYIHRLRRRLEEHYRAAPEGGDRLFVPRGEYRLSVAAADTVPVVEDDPIEAVPVEPVPDPPKRQRRPMWLAALALLLLANIGAWLWFSGIGRPSRPAQVAATPLWAPLAHSDRPTVIVLGDYYIFGEAPQTVEVTRLVREFSINSREDLDQYLMQHPDEMGRYVNLDLHYLPVGTAAALAAVLPVVEQVGGKRPVRTRIVTMSQLTPDLLKGADIVYVGYLSGLGLLRDAVFDVSNFSVGTSYDELIDNRTGRRYRSDFSEVEGGRTPHRDYGYVASLPGPAGNHILIIAGTRDAALTQMAESAVNPDQIAQIGQRTGDAESVEALYEVRTLGNTNFAGRLVQASRLRSGPGGRESRSFPDVLPTER
jgi:hypothetical protein